MFVQDSIIVSRPVDEIVVALTEGVHLGRAARGAGEALSDIRVKVGPQGWPMLLAKTVEITTGPVRQHDRTMLVAFSWRATGPGSLFPSLDADIEVSPISPGQSQVALRGRYEPPGGAPGKVADRLVLHRLADATIRAFLSQLALQLERANASQEPSGRPA
ncbi:MAG: hypothetical protein ACP5VR_10825 [Acidimicrobiales bacterium]